MDLFDNLKLRNRLLFILVTSIFILLLLPSLLNSYSLEPDSKVLTHAVLKLNYNHCPSGYKKFSKSYHLGDYGTDRVRACGKRVNFSELDNDSKVVIDMKAVLSWSDSCPSGYTKSSHDSHDGKYCTEPLKLCLKKTTKENVLNTDDSFLNGLYFNNQGYSSSCPTQTYYNWKRSSLHTNGHSGDYCKDNILLCQKEYRCADFDEDGYYSYNSHPDCSAADMTRDCDDTDASLNWDDVDGDGYSTCDGDCDDTNASLNLDDADGDGYSTCDGDCNDTNHNVNPGLPENPYNDFDDNCDGNLDKRIMCYDYDEDGFFSERSDSECTNAPFDCDDRDPTKNSNSSEICDFKDNDCDGDVDEGLNCCVDRDEDNYNSTIYPDDRCGVIDCNDDNPSIYPGNGCDGSDLESSFFGVCKDGYYWDGHKCVTLTCTDSDDDGYNATSEGCGLDDCDDSNTSINPNATEVCDNNVDDDCDGLVDLDDEECGSAGTAGRAIKLNISDFTFSYSIMGVLEASVVTNASASCQMTTYPSQDFGVMTYSFTNTTQVSSSPLRYRHETVRDINLSASSYEVEVSCVPTN